MRSDTAVRQLFLSSSGLDSYSVSFPVYAASELLVKVQSGTDAERTLVLGTDYSVSNLSPFGGAKVNLLRSVGAGSTVCVMSKLPYAQELSLGSATAIRPATLETQLDRTAQQIQQIAQSLERKVGIADTASGTAPAVGWFEEQVSAASGYASAALGHAVTASSHAEGASGSMVSASGHADRAEAALGSLLMETGYGEAQAVLTASSAISSGSLITMPQGMVYMVGRQHLKVAVGGMLADYSMLTEVGSADSPSSAFKLGFDVASGQKIHLMVGGIVHIPNMSGQSGKVLTNDGSSALWSTMSGLPPQSGQSGKCLMSDGDKAVWGMVDVSGSIASHNEDASAHSGIRTALSGKADSAYVTGYVSGAVSGLASSSYVTGYVSGAVSGLVDSAYVSSAVSGLTSSTYVSSYVSGEVSGLVASAAMSSYVSGAVSGLVDSAYVGSAVSGLASSSYVSSAMTSHNTDNAAHSGIIGNIASVQSSHTDLVDYIDDTNDSIGTLSDQVLHLTGGTISGGLGVTGILAAGATITTPGFLKIKNASYNSKYIAICSATDIGYGAYLQVIGSEYTAASLKGAFKLAAVDADNSTEYVLFGRINGSLKWNGNEVLTTANGYLALPTQSSGTNGQFLKSNGSTASWATVDALPTQSAGTNGQFLKSNGSTASWATVTSMATVTDTASTMIALPTAAANTNYSYGELLSLALGFSASGTANDAVHIMFKSGATATTLTVDGTNALFGSFTPNTNAVVEIDARFYAPLNKWVVLFSQVSTSN